MSLGFGLRWLAVMMISACFTQAGLVADEIIEPSPITRVANTLSPSNWKMPQFKMPNFKGILPQKEEKQRIQEKKESLFGEVSQTASRSWQKTKETLNPSKLNPVRFFQASDKRPVVTQPPQPEKPGFFQSLFGPPQVEPQRNMTVTDFLNQAKPQ